MSRSSPRIYKIRSDAAAVPAVALPFPCTMCREEFPMASQFQRHLRTKHAHGYYCNYCIFASPLLAEVVTHAELHKKKRPLVCATCGHCFANKYLLKKHTFIHNPDSKPVQCTQCSVRFMDHSSRRTHEMSKHNGVKPHKCPHCDFRAPTHALLNRHVSTHLSEKPFHCPFCDFQTKCKASLARHRCRLRKFNTRRAIALPSTLTTEENLHTSQRKHQVELWTFEFTVF